MAMRLHYRRKKGTVDEWLIDERVYLHGREIRKRETFKGTKAEVESRCLEIRRVMKQRGEQAVPVVEHKPQTFGAILSKYRECRKEERGDVDETRFNALIKNLGDVPLESLADRMQDYLKLLKSDVSKKTGKRLSNGSQNRLLTMANAALNFAVNMEMIEKNPLSRGRFRKLPETPRDVTLSSDQRTKLLEIIDRRAPHLSAITRFAFQIPCRKSELVNMRREDLDMENGFIRVRSGTTKNGMGCDKLIPPEMMDYFKSIPPESEFLFYREENGRYFGLGDFKTAWLKCLKELGIKNVFHFHDTRRIAATDLVNNGTPERVVAALAGWKSTAMLTTYYAKNTSLHLVKFRPSLPKPDTSDRTLSGS